MEKLRQRLFLTFVALLAQASFLLPLGAQEEQTPPANVAIVNGTAITQNAFDRELRDIQKRLVKMGKAVNDDQLQEIKKEVLEALIDRELLYQESLNSGIKVEDNVIDEQFTSLKNRLPSEDEFNNAMKDMNLSKEELTTQMRHDLAIQQFIQKKFNDSITVPEKESKGFYDKNPDAFKEIGEIRASQILIQVDPKGDKKNACANSATKVNNKRRRIFSIHVSP